jgi:7,8-dihydropterin-6-yl-methyl-4-(beta-D-ribofuranosyl)aminobenzene 5'-phosphate synthase
VLLACPLVGASEPATNSITVVSTHQAGKSKKEISVRGASSLWVNVGGKVVLFDTGVGAIPPNQFLVNQGLDPTALDAIVLSHDRSGQIRGLADLVSVNDVKMKVYFPAPAGETFSEQLAGANVVSVSKPVGVVPDAWLVGPIESAHGLEQVLVLDVPDGLVIVAGCTQTDIVSIVNEVKAVFGARKVKMVAGGFHLQARSKREIKEISLELQTMGIDQLALSSCTGQAALKIFRKEWGNRVVSFDSGDTIGF